MIRAEEDSVNKVYVRSETSEEFIFWFRSLQKMIADMKEKEKEIKRRNKMLVSLKYCPKVFDIKRGQRSDLYSHYTNET